MNIDLNINNYTKIKLERLFQLPSNYTPSDIMNKENELYLNLMKLNINVSTKENIILFLKQARDQLMPQPEILAPEPLILTKPPTEIKIINIDTVLRPQYLITQAYNYSYKFEYPIPNVTSFTISSIELPVHWYTFSDKSTFVINNDTIHIPEGNYTEQEFVTMFHELSDIEIKIHNKTILYAKESFTLTINTDTLYKTAGWYLGFRNSSYTSVYNPVESRHEIVSECPYGHQSNYLFLEINDFHETFTTDKVFSIGSTEYEYNKNIMARIPLQNNTMIHLKDGFSTKTYKTPILLERINIRFINKYKELFKLTTDYSISFQITTI